MINVRIIYCAPCGFLPRASDLANNLLQSLGIELNKNLAVTLEPSDGGVFDVYVDSELVFSRKLQGGRFPAPSEIVEAVRKSVKKQQ